MKNIRINYLIIIILVLFSFMNILVISCTEEEKPAPIESNFFTNFSGYTFSENFETLDNVNVADENNTADFTPGSSVPQGESTLITIPISIDTTFYRFDSLTLYFTGTISTVKFYNQTTTSAVLFSINEPLGGGEILLSTTPVINIDNLVLAFDLASGCSLNGYDLKRAPILPITKSTFFVQPSPFNPNIELARFRFALFENSKVTLSIYTSFGSLVEKVISGSNRIGDQSTGIAYGDDYWDGRDDDGYPVNSGVYLCELKLESTEGGGTTTLKTELAVIY